MSAMPLGVLASLSLPITSVQPGGKQTNISWTLQKLGMGTRSHLPWRSASWRHPRTAWWVLGRGMGLGGAEEGGRGAQDAWARSRGCSTRVPLPGVLHAQTCRQRPLLTTKRAPTLLPAPSAGHVSACPWLFWAALATAWGGGSTEPRPLPCKAPRKPGCSLQGWKCPQQGPRWCPGWAVSWGGWHHWGLISDG